MKTLFAVIFVLLTGLALFGFSLFFSSGRGEGATALRVHPYFASYWVIQYRTQYYPFWRDLEKTFVLSAKAQRNHPYLFDDFNEAAAEAARLSHPGQLDAFIAEQDRLYAEAKALPPDMDTIYHILRSE